MLQQLADGRLGNLISSPDSISWRDQDEAAVKHCHRRHTVVCDPFNAELQRQTAVTANLKSKQLLLLAFDHQYKIYPLSIKAI